MNCEVSVLQTLNVFNIQHFSLHDGPGIRTVIFLKGCSLNCAWCHNPESKSSHKELAFYASKCTFCGKCVKACPNGAHVIKDRVHHLDRSKCSACGRCAEACDFAAVEILGKDYTIHEIMTEIKKDDVYFGEDGGVTISGGEPFMQAEGLLELLKKCKEAGYSVCIETSGFTSAEKLLSAAEYVDMFLYDYKLTDTEKHKEYVGADNHKILDNLAALNEAGAKIVLRCPIIPLINDCEAHFKGIAEIAEAYENIDHVELMPYHSLGISKAKQIGMEAGYAESGFLSVEQAGIYAQRIQALTVKKVLVSK